MSNPLTDELLEELLAAPDPTAFLDKTSQEVQSLSSYLNQLLREKSMKRIDVIHRASLNETHGYQIFQGTRHASRDKLLALALAMGLTLKETDKLLQAGASNSLYAKNRRDAILIFCISHGYDYQKTNEELFRFGEETLT